MLGADICFTGDADRCSVERGVEALLPGIANAAKSFIAFLVGALARWLFLLTSWRFAKPSTNSLAST